MGDKKEGFFTRAAKVLDGAVDTAVEAGRDVYGHATKALSGDPFWQPIGTADHLEGQEIFALHEPSEEVWIVRWREYTKSWQIKAAPETATEQRRFEPTHWAAIPRDV